MWTFLTRWLSCSARRSAASQILRGQELDRRELLSAAVVGKAAPTTTRSSPQLGFGTYFSSYSIINQATETGRLIVGPTATAGATLIPYYAYSQEGPVTIRLSGNRGGAFGVRPWGTPSTGSRLIAVDSLLAPPTGEIYVANPRALRPGAKFELKVTGTDPQGGTTTQTLVVIIPNSTISVTTAENASEGTILGSLPADLSRPRMRTTVLANSYARTFRGPWITSLDYLRNFDSGVGQPSPIRLEGGQLIASPSSKADLQVDGYDRRFNFEESAITLEEGIRLSGHTVLQVFDRITRQTQYVIVQLKLTNVKEQASIADQTVDTDLTGKGSLIRYNVPDGNSWDGLYQMRIIGGDPDGLFEFRNGYALAYQLIPNNSPFYVAVKDPSRVQIGQIHSLTVELLENGESVGTAVLTVRVVEPLSDVVILNYPIV